MYESMMGGEISIKGINLKAKILIVYQIEINQLEFY